MKFEDLSPEQQQKARACKTPEELLALAKEEGYELSDEELNSLSGGSRNHPEWLGPECKRVQNCAIDI